LLDCHCSARHCRHPTIDAEYTSMLLSAHAIWAAAPQRREPNIAATTTNGG
jgi:hypothetical protein